MSIGVSGQNLYYNAALHQFTISANTSPVVAVTAGRVGVNAQNPLYDLDINGAQRVGHFVSKTFTVPLAGAVGSATNVCSITTSGTSFGLRVVTVQSVGSNSICKMYQIPVYSNSSPNWTRCTPHTTSGPDSSGADFALEVINNAFAGTPPFLRLVRTGTSSAAGSVTVLIEIAEAFNDNVAITVDNATTSGVTTSGLYGGTSIVTHAPTGNVGIKMAVGTTPVADLDINGQIHFASNAPALLVGNSVSTLNSSIQIAAAGGVLETGVAGASGIFASDAVAGDSVIRQTNPSNRLLIASGNTVQSAIAVKNANVGFSQPNPAYTVDINGPTRAGNTVLTTVSGGNSVLGCQTLASSISTSYALLQNAVGDTQLNAAAGQPVTFRVNSTEYARLHSNGMFGIACTPSFQLDCAGGARFTGTATFTGLQSASNAVTAYFASGVAIGGSTSTNAAVNLNTASGSSPYYGMDVNSVGGGALGLDASDNGKFKITTGIGSGTFGTGNTRMTITQTGQIGFGTSSPAYFLDTQGTARFTGTVTLDASAPVVSLTSSLPGDIVARTSGTSGDRSGFGLYSGSAVRLFTSGTAAGATVNLSVPTGSTQNSTATFNDYLTMTTTGRIGINKTNPQYTLDTAGDINLSGTLRSNGVAMGLWTQSGTSVYYNAPVTIGGTGAPSYGQLLLKSQADSTNATASLTALSTDGFPLAHHNSWAHDNVAIIMDGYYDGTSYRRSHTSAPYQLAKQGGLLRVQASTASTAGSVPAWTSAMAFNPTGQVGINKDPSTSYALDINGSMNISGTILNNGVPLGAAPTGVVVAFAATASPTGWLLCDGSAVSRSTYSALFNVIGATYGGGDGSTTFNVPNMATRTVAGYTTGDGNFNVMGKTGGSTTQTMTVEQMPQHSHAITDNGHSHGISDPNHVHYVAASGRNFTTNGGGAYAITQLGRKNGDNGGGGASDPVPTNVATVSAGTGISVQNNGSGTAFSVLQPYMTMQYIIKT